MLWTGRSRKYLKARLLAMVGASPRHRHDRRDRVSGVASSAPDTVAVDRALKALERDGLAESRWGDPPSGSARRNSSIASS